VPVIVILLLVSVICYSLPLLISKYKNASNPPTSLADGLCVHKQSFQRTGLQKMQEVNILYLKASLVSPNGPWKTAVAVLWRIFSSNKSEPANRKKGFYTTRLPKK
jgi:hypothetical protein